MNCMKLVIVFVFAATGIIFSADTYAEKISGVDIPLSADLPNGVYCEINDVILIAQDKDNCSTAGGEVIKVENNKAKDSK
ncbi:MAG: hypothetical protein AAF462_11620 [Thermodesulfobacteriota bacterium]